VSVISLMETSNSSRRRSGLPNRRGTHGIEMGFLSEVYDAMDHDAVAEKYAGIVGMPVAVYMTEGATDT
jgi:hypothetical protein